MCILNGNIGKSSHQITVANQCTNTLIPVVGRSLESNRFDFETWVYSY